MATPEINERKMGTETKHQAVIEDKCSCGESRVVTFKYLDHPDGVKVTSEVEFMGNNGKK